MKTCYCLFVLLLALESANAQHLNTTFQITPFLNVHGYTWKEFDDNGTEALKETGPRFAFGAISRYSFLVKKNMFIEMDLCYTIGTVDYQGFKFDLQTGQRTPFTTQTGYSHFEVAANAGYDIGLSRTFLLTPIAGFGYEVWNRDIAINDPSGYAELYTVFLGNLGSNATYIATGNFQLFFGVTVKFPFSISETIDKFPRGQPQQTNVSISPGVNPRLGFHLGGSAYRVFAMFDFETWTLSRSPDVQGGLHQPESTRMRFGVRLGYTIGVI